MLQACSLYGELYYFAVHFVFDSRLLRIFQKKDKFLIGTAPDFPFFNVFVVPHFVFALNHSPCLSLHSELPDRIPAAWEQQWTREWIP